MLLPVVEAFCYHPFMTAIDKIREIYKEIPDIDCKGLCSEACGPILMTKPEREVLKSHGYKGHNSNLECSLLGVNLRCQAYEHRPTICRLWGTINPILLCPYGCEPRDGSRLLDDKQARAIIDRINTIAGEKTKWL